MLTSEIAPGRLPPSTLRLSDQTEPPACVASFRQFSWFPRDTAVIAALLLPSYHLVTGRSVQSHGVSEEVAILQGMFADSTLLYVRRTREVRANPAWGLAEELGDWTGRLTAPDGPVRVNGSYAAKWQRDTGGAWRLQSEVFTTLRCEGGPQGCKPPDPVTPTALK